jgi:hypothetical protein
MLVVYNLVVKCALACVTELLLLTAAATALCTLQMAVKEAYDCLVEGTDEAYNIYAENMRPGGALRFETYDVSGTEDWRKRWRRVITSVERDEDDYTAFFEAISPDLGRLFGPPQPKRLSWLSMLDDDEDVSGFCNYFQ